MSVFLGYSHQVELLKLDNCCLITLPFDDFYNVPVHEVFAWGEKKELDIAAYGNYYGHNYYP